MRVARFRPDGPPGTSMVLQCGAFSTEPLDQLRCQSNTALNQQQQHPCLDNRMPPTRRTPGEPSQPLVQVRMLQPRARNPTAIRGSKGGG